ncbi:zona pellucida glycoprotein 3d tandem duplicate 1 [Oncorhynchus kisutch]|uniref:Zona pellucida sperm-binding protein 3 n=1 Tax=Oncorhynchus kisutch TaxID=8019 RepID=A0A8C7CCH6_ONCKI|nr:uncharacterized protein LOC109901648 [Oncorhynchus kisutch]
MVQVAWMFCLFACFFSAFPFTQVSAEADFNVDRWEGQVHQDYQFAERHLLGNVPVREVIRPRIGEDDAIGAQRSEPPYYFLPMFQHSAVPVVDRDLFRPVVGKIRFPSILTTLLFPPQNSPERNHFSPVRNPHGVEVWCGYNQISVRINRSQLRFRCLASMLFLGTCPVTRVTPLFFYFHYDLNDCGSTQTTMNGQLVYTSSLRFSPEPQGPVIRAIPLNLPIQCIYNRFHYSYKVGYVPEVHDRNLLKSMNGKHIFRLTACNEQWEQLSSEEGYMLGEPMYFKAYAAFVPKDESVFVDSCFVTTSNDPNATPRLEVIHNFGCMVDSKRKGSQSQFFSRESNVLRFTVDAFLFPQITAKHLYLHCTMTVMKSTSKWSAKSCTYNSTVGRWEELYGPPSVCSCCDSVCEVSEFWPALTSPSVKSLITSKPWRVLEDREKSLPVQAEERQPDGEERVEETLAVTYRVEKVKFKSLAVAPWEEEKNMSVAVMNKVEEVQEGTVLGEEGVVARKEGSVEEPIEDKWAEKEMIEVAAEEIGTDQVTSSVTLEHVPEENTVTVKEVAQWNMSSVTMNAKVSKKAKEQVAGIEGSTVERVGVGQMPLVDEAAAFLQGYMEPAEWREDYQGPALEEELGRFWKPSTKDKLAVLETSVPIGTLTLN